MDTDLTWSDVEDVVEAVSVRLLEDDGPLTDRPSKRQRLAPVSEHDPKPAPEVLPGLAWSGWGDLAAAMGLNSTDGPAFVHGVARLHAEQRRHYALPPKERAQSMPLVDVTLQRLSATLRRAQAGAVQSSGLAAAQQAQHQRQDAAPSSDGSAAREPLLQQWPPGMPSATQLMGSQADELVAVGAVDFVILGKDWLARGNRGKEVVYLLQFQGQAAGEEDWVQARKIKKDHPCGADLIAEYERALEAGELDESQQQSQLHNPGAYARMSQQSQQGPSMPVIPEAAPQKAADPPAAQPQQQRPQQQQQQQQPQEAAEKSARKTRDPRLQQQAGPSGAAGNVQASQPPPAEQQAAGDAAAARQPATDIDAAAAETRQPRAASQVPSQVTPSQPTDSQWLAGETQTQAQPVPRAALDWVPFTQPSQPEKAGDGLHRQPLPAQPTTSGNLAVAPTATTALPTAAAAEAAEQPAAAPAPQAAAQLPPPEDSEAAPGSDMDTALPNPDVQRGVAGFLWRLSGGALKWGGPPQAAQAQQQVPLQQPQPPVEPVALRQPPPQQQAQLPVAAAVVSAGNTASGQQAQRPKQQDGKPKPGAAAAAGGAAAAQGQAAGPSPAISLSDSSSDEEEEDELDPELRAHLQPDKWADARITGASKHDDGMEISVTWDDDGFTSGISNELLKAKVHCRLKLIEFYESKIKAVSRKKRNK